MSTIDVKAHDAKLHAFERALATVVPNGRQYQEEQCLAKSYAAIKAALARKVPMKTVLETFNAAYELKTHPARFRKLLQKERDARKEAEATATGKHDAVNTIAADTNSEVAA